jgi:hypothetical protein
MMFWLRILFCALLAAAASARADNLMIDFGELHEGVEHLYTVHHDPNGGVYDSFTFAITQAELDAHPAEYPGYYWGVVLQARDLGGADQLQYVLYHDNHAVANYLLNYLNVYQYVTPGNYKLVVYGETGPASANYFAYARLALIPEPSQALLLLAGLPLILAWKKKKAAVAAF